MTRTRVANPPCVWDNGNQTGRGADTFAYDHENRLTQAVVGGVTSSSTYNGDGLRMSHTVGAGTTNYMWDTAAELPVVLQDGTNTYVYGLDLISTTDGAGTQTYHLYDGLGSTVGLADEDGNPVDDYTYDVFGAIRSQSGSSANYWLFTGEQRDTESSFYYLRARYYDPAIGRFLAQDPLMGSAMAPLSLNRYPYVLNNPLRWLDPWGLRNVEGTPTPTPSAKYLVCKAVHEQNVDCRYLVPSGGGGIWDAVGDAPGFIGEGLTAYWESRQSDITYLDMYTAIINWFANTCPGQVVLLGVGTGVATAGIALMAAEQPEGIALVPVGYEIANPGPPGSMPLEACW